MSVEPKLRHRTSIRLKIRLLALLWLSATIIASPLLIILAVRAKKNTPRLPEASGTDQGEITTANSNQTTNLLLIGESPVAGVGVTNYQDSLAATTARHLAKLKNVSVNWKAIGKNGITISETVRTLVPQLANQQIDYLVVMLGVNDVTSLTSLNGWHRSIDELIAAIKKFTNAKIVFYGCPPLMQFPALAKPLAISAGTRAKLFDLVTLNHPLNGVEFGFTAFNAIILASQFAEDGYHPSQLGCQEMGKRIAKDIINLYP